MTQPRLTLETCPEGHTHAVYRWRTFRFLISDGSTVDIEAIRDDSDLREAVVKQFVPKDGRIEGVAALEVANE